MATVMMAATCIAATVQTIQLYSPGGTHVSPHLIHSFLDPHKSSSISDGSAICAVLLVVPNRHTDRAMLVGIATSSTVWQCKLVVNTLASVSVFGAVIVAIAILRVHLVYVMCHMATTLRPCQLHWQHPFPWAPATVLSPFNIIDHARS